MMVPQEEDVQGKDNKKVTCGQSPWEIASEQLKLLKWVLDVEESPKRTKMCTHPPTAPFPTLSGTNSFP